MADGMGFGTKVQPGPFSWAPGVPPGLGGACAGISLRARLGAEPTAIGRDKCHSSV